MNSIERIINKEILDRSDIIELLSMTDPEKLNLLYSKANEVRKIFKGDNVHLRGIIEFSNYCERLCTYCGLRERNDSLQRYRIPTEEIVQIAKKAYELGYRTVVLQSGEDYYYTIDKIVDIIKRIKAEVDLIITLSVGERTEEEYIQMKEAGGNRYLLKHETSDRELYKLLHPDMSFDNRINCLKTLKKLGFEVGSGIMIGLPNQTLDSIADDLLLFKELQVDMIGMGPYIPHPGTPLYSIYQETGYFAKDLDFNIEEMVYKAISITRLINKNANIPATTALATTNPAQGRELALNRGANILMPNVTDKKYRTLYEIYPSKVCVDERPEDCRGCIEKRIKSINRTPV